MTSVGFGDNSQPQVLIRGGITSVPTPPSRPNPIGTYPPPELCPVCRECPSVPSKNGLHWYIACRHQHFDFFPIAPDNCLSLSSPTNGRVSASSTAVGSTATYSCNPGYSLVGASTRSCESQGSAWSGNTPSCQGPYHMLCFGVSSCVVWYTLFYCCSTGVS